MGSYIQKMNNNRYFNGFGIIKPDDNVKMPVFCEINVEKDGLNKNTAGAFAKDLTRKFIYNSWWKYC